MGNRTKTRTLIWAALFMGVSLLSVGASLRYRNVEEYEHADGTYRGTFVDEGRIQVNVEFVLADGVITSATY